MFVLFVSVSYRGRIKEKKNATVSVIRDSGSGCGAERYQNNY